MIIRDAIISLLLQGSGLNSNLVVRRLTRDAKGRLIRSETAIASYVSGSGAIIVEESDGWTVEDK